MSVKVIGAVFDRYPVGGSEMLLAMVLADAALDDGRVLTDDLTDDLTSELARKARQSCAAVRRNLRRMEQRGWLRAVHDGEGAAGRASICVIEGRSINEGAA